MQKRNLTYGVALVALITVVACAAEAMDDMAAAAPGDVPLFQVDPFWPKPLPQNWLIGPTIGVDVDSNDHIWIVHRNTENQFAARTEIGLAQDPPLASCCQPGFPVMRFDQDGNLVGAWGGPGTETGDYTWPESNHGITVDNMGNVWIGGNGGQDRHILKFTSSGEFLGQFGEPGAAIDSNSDTNFGMVAKVSFDEENNEIYVADGYANQRVAVLDATSGDMKRYWGAYGNRPTDERPPAYVPGETPPQDFRTPVHCADRANDGMVYVCDRPSNRISVFTTEGEFVKESIIAPATLSQGSTGDGDFSPDPGQQFMYMADGQNMKVYVMDRESLEVLYSFGDGGRQPGLFFAPHSIAVDTDGNIYTTETYEGSRLQKFVNMGMGPNPGGDIGPAWPADRKSGEYGWRFN